MQVCRPRLHVSACYEDCSFMIRDSSWLRPCYACTVNQFCVVTTPHIGPLLNICLALLPFPTKVIRNKTSVLPVVCGCETWSLLFWTEHKRHVFIKKFSENILVWLLLNILSKSRCTVRPVRSWRKGWARLLDRMSQGMVEELSWGNG